MIGRDGTDGLTTGQTKSNRQSNLKRSPPPAYKSSLYICTAKYCCIKFFYIFLSDFEGGEEGREAGGEERYKGEGKESEKGDSLFNL